MAKFGAKVGVGVPGVAFADCSLEYDCNAQRGEGKCSSCHRTVSPDVIILGRRSSGDHCFVDDTLRATPNGTYNERHLQYPTNMADVGRFVITAVMVCDDWKDGTGGVVTLVSGGVGQDHVRVKVQSQYMRGYRFKVAVYGRRVR